MAQPKLLFSIRYRARARHLSRRTEVAYVNFIKRFILFHNKRHPKEMGADEIQAFLTHLAVEKNFLLDRCPHMGYWAACAAKHGIDTIVLSRS